MIKALLILEYTAGNSQAYQIMKYTPLPKYQQKASKALKGLKRPKPDKV